MLRIILIVMMVAVFFLGCETTGPRQEKSEKTDDGPVSVTVGGEVQVRGQYIDSH